MRLRAVIFDVDGTLAETEEIHRAAFNSAFEALGFLWQWDRPLYKELLRVTGGKERILHYLTQCEPQHLAEAAPQIPRMHELKTQKYAALVQEGAMQLRPGVARLIHEIKSAGLGLAIATTTSRSNVDALLRRTLGPQSEALFDAIVAGDDTAAKKPDPEAFEIALKRLGLSSRAFECVAIEDSANGVIGARAAGLEVIVTPSVYSADDNFSGAASVVSDLGEPGQPHQHVAGWRWSHGVVSVEAVRARWN